MKEQSGIYLDFDEYLIEQEKKLNIIYKELVKNNEDKNAIKKFDRIVKSNLDYKGLLPCSKSYEGESLLTLSKTWMILILLKIKKGKAQQEQFLTLVNSSLTHELNEYNEYREFYEEQCEILFSEEEAIKQINLNPKLPKKINNNIDHDELKNYYIYLLFKPKYFQKVEFEELSKTKKIGKKSEKSNKNKKGLKSNNTSSIILDSGSDSEENDEKADRLNEKDMISKNRAKQPSSNIGAKNNKNSSNKNQKNKKKVTIEDDEDYEKINDILNKKGKSGNKKEEAKKEKKQNKRNSVKQKIIDKEDETSENEDIDIDKDINKSKENKKNKKNEKTSITDKKNKYKKKFEENEESEYEKNKKGKGKGKGKGKEKEKKDKKNEKEKKNKKEDKKKNRASSEKILELLGIDKSLIESDENEDEKEEEKTKKNSDQKNKKN